MVRGIDRFRDLGKAGLHLSELTANAADANLLTGDSIVLHSIPPLPGQERLALHLLIESSKPWRLVYISSTSVYGDHVEIDEQTAARPTSDAAQMRVEEENWVASGPWTHLILRSAAIYGPGRGVHVSLRQGKLPRGAGSGVVSRIHVDDLAALIEAGIFSGLGGAWPVADEDPCATSEIIAWCVKTLRLPGVTSNTGEFATSGRRVNGRKVCDLLGVKLTYPSWRTGVRASLLEEESAGG